MSPPSWGPSHESTAMNPLALNLMLAAGWAALTGSFTLGNLLIGGVVGYIALWVAKPLFGPTTYFERVWRVWRPLWTISKARNCKRSAITSGIFWSS